MKRDVVDKPELPLFSTQSPPASRTAPMPRHGCSQDAKVSYPGMQITECSASTQVQGVLCLNCVCKKCTSGSYTAQRPGTDLLVAVHISEFSGPKGVVGSPTSPLCMGSGLGGIGWRLQISEICFSLRRAKGRGACEQCKNVDTRNPSINNQCQCLYHYTTIPSISTIPKQCPYHSV